MGPLARRWHRRLVAVVTLALLVTLLLWYKEDIREIPDRWHGPLFNPEPGSSIKSPSDIFTASYKSRSHPINHLLDVAEVEAAGFIKKELHDVSAAAAAYRERRGRHPPPDFDEWFDFATAHGCVVVEDFFDQIHRDIEPFWALSASEIRHAAAGLPDFVRVRKGKVEKSTNERPFVDAYFNMLKEIEAYLPDVDLPINTMDESRILVPWEDITDMISLSARGKNLQNLPTVTSFRPLPEPTRATIEYLWLNEGPYWDIARKGCPPESPGRSAEIDTDFSTPPSFPSTWPSLT